MDEWNSRYARIFIYHGPVLLPPMTGSFVWCHLTLEAPFHRVMSEKEFHKSRSEATATPGTRAATTKDIIFKVFLCVASLRISKRAALRDQPRDKN